MYVKGKTTYSGVYEGILKPFNDFIKSGDIEELLRQKISEEDT